MVMLQYLFCFLSGLFLANFVPHFVYGISGNKFPTPFAKPSGIGLSSATTNMIWSLFNLLVGYLLLLAGAASPARPVSMLLLFAGVAAMGIPLSRHFTKKHKE